MKKVFLRYNDIHRMCQNIAKEIQSDGWTPDCIVAISGGGLIPARILRSFLHIPIYTISVQRYDDVTAVQPVPVVKQWLNDSETQIRDKKILIVDEVDDTRITLAFCTRQLEHDAPADMRIAVLTQKNKQKEGELSASVSKIYAGQHINDVWVVYPWESEDIDAHDSGA